MKRTEPSTNRKFTPPGDGLPKPGGIPVQPELGITPVGGIAPGLEISRDLTRHDRVRLPSDNIVEGTRMVTAKHVNIRCVMAQGEPGGVLRGFNARVKI